jgi:hypothetical protein
MERLVRVDDIKNCLKNSECRIESGELQTKNRKGEWVDLLSTLRTGTAGKTVDTGELREYIRTHHCEIENRELISLEGGKWDYLLSCVGVRDLGETWDLGLENFLRAEGVIAAEENRQHERRNNGNQNDDQQVRHRDNPIHNDYDR